MTLELWKDEKKFSGYDKNLVRTLSIQTRGGLFWGFGRQKRGRKEAENWKIKYKTTKSSIKT